MCLATLPNDRDTAPVQQLVDDDAHSLVTTNPTAWFPALESTLTGSAALVIVLIRKWSEPSGFTQNVQRTQRIVSGQDVILQSLGVIRSHSPHDNAVDHTDGHDPEAG